MSYTPKFCCECGDKIDRAVWRFWTNRRFCEFCATNFGIYDTVKNAVIVILALSSIVGFANMLGKSEKRLIVSSNRQAADYQSADKQNFVRNSPPAANSGKPDSSNLPPANPNNADAPQMKSSPADSNRNPTPPKQTTEKSVEPAAEAVYFCGAQTKKGTPCTRRVKNGGRCWQHAGQPAMLPQQKLLTSR